MGKALAKRSNIVDPTFEACLSSKMFDSLATSKTLLVEHFGVRQAQNVFEFFQTTHYKFRFNLTFACQAMFDRLAVAAFPTLLVKHFFCL